MLGVADSLPCTQSSTQRTNATGGQTRKYPPPPVSVLVLPPSARSHAKVRACQQALAVMMARTRHAALCLMVAVLTTTYVIPEVGAFTGGLRAALTPHECSVVAQQTTSVRPRSASRNNPTGTLTNRYCRCW